MPAANPLLFSFNGGEASPFLDLRTDLRKYNSLCTTLENFILLPYGAALSRPGTEFLGQLKYPNRRARLHGFNFSVTTNFILEFGDRYVRFWSNGLQVQVAGNPVEVSMPYVEQDLRSLQFCQINDLLYICHPDYPPAKLSRIADDEWEYEEVRWKFPPTLDENIKDIVILPSGVEGNITLESNEEIFKPGHVGSYWVIGHSRSGNGASYVDIALLDEPNESDELWVIGDWELTTYGNWSGELYVQRAFPDSSTWETIRTYTSGSEGQRNVSAVGTEERICALRLLFADNGEEGTLNPQARLEVGESVYYGSVKITGYIDPQNVEAEVIEQLFPGDEDEMETKLWQEAAFSNEQGWPRTVCLSEGRLNFAGTKKKPLTLYGSVVEDFENFRKTEKADASFAFTIWSNESNPINWMVTQSGRMLIGTAGEEWSMAPTDEATVLGPTNVRAKRESSYGSAYVQARVVNEVVLFVQRQGRKIRELVFAFEKDGYVAPDLTIFANHISFRNPLHTSGAGFVETAFQQQPDSIFWCITRGGQLVGMTYERDQEVIGWHAHTTQGEFESVASIYGGDDPDEVWVVVKREVDGQIVRYMERFYGPHRDVLEAEDKDNWWYLDAGVRTISDEFRTVVDGLEHLEGETVAILADGATQAPRVVSGGEIVLQNPAKNVLVGLSYTPILRTMNMDVPIPDGTAQTRRGKIHTVSLVVHKSIGFEFSNNDENAWHPYSFRQPEYLMDASVPAFSGVKRFSTGAAYADFCSISIRQNTPMPLCILGMKPAVQFHGQ